ncbi:troponin C, isoallergen Bla g 6.0101-like isoform X2 [Frankliniella occidentalis]|uniref:Troponin C, isoallergen Bla g 6.0101-like isoform X2 n=1 Tax=Frankliniella occidentalis TaxID=133901 RepID=A0A9C6WZE3_FRAOC|nr:troponin C, isoallergen Bla g 6.0101-like isoform X2 [Frankliniella occidentalis]
MVSAALATDANTIDKRWRKRTSTSSRWPVSSRRARAGVRRGADVLRKAFDSFDTENKGCIGTDMVQPILEMFGQKVSGNALKEVIAEADADGSGELEFEEFANLAAKFMVEEDTSMLKDELRQAFLLFDREGNGYITTEQLREILFELDGTITPSDMDNIIDEIDADGSGTVDFEEFMAVMCGDD